MNGCDKYQELISCLIDGELSKREQSVLAGHLEECVECAALYSVFSEVSNSIADGLENPPASLAEDIMADIRRSNIRKKNFAPYKKVLAAAACVAVILLAAGGILPRLLTRSPATVMTAAAPTVDAADSAVVYSEASVQDRAVAEEAASEVAEDVNEDVAADEAAAPAPAEVPAAVATAAPTQAPKAAGYGEPYASAAVETAAPNAPNDSLTMSSSGAGKTFMTASGNTLPDEEDEPTRVEIDTNKRWTKLMTLLSGKEPKTVPDLLKADGVYLVVLMPDDKHELTVYLFDNEVYYTVSDKTVSPPPEDVEPIVLLAKCKAADFLKFIEP